MGIRSLLKAGAVCLLCVYCVNTSAVTVTINTAVERQTIDGFGFFGGSKVWWSGNDPLSFYSDAWFDLVLNNLGMTILRTEYYSEEPRQDATWAKQTPFIKAITAKAKEFGVPLKHIWSVWTPPSAMKTNNDLKNGGSLKPASYTEFGNWLVKGIDNYINAGVDMYAISPQNEPLFPEPYNSCVYSPRETYRDMLKVVGPIIHAKYPKVLIFGSEHMLFGAGKDWDWNNLDPTQPVMNDPAAKAELGIFACHGYGADGKTPTSTSEEAIMWSTAWKNVGASGKPIWMTETSGFTTDWAGSIDYAMSIHAALFYGRLSGWVHYYGGAGDFVTGGALNKQGYAAKHYFRYVRPGAKALTVTVSGDPELLVTAFKHAANNQFSIVAINTGTAQKSVTLSGTGLPASFQVFRSSATENCAAQGNVAGTDFTLPANSITTLFYQGASSTRKPAITNRAVVARPGVQVRVYGLDGRRITPGLARGMRYVGVVDGNGKAVLKPNLRSW